LSGRSKSLGGSRWRLEGGYVETPERLIFAVKGLVHLPDRIVAYLRYVADPAGDRVREGVRYRRVYGFEEQLAIVRSRYPQYLHYDEAWDVELQSVPHDRVWRVYDPSEGLRRLMGSRADDPLAQAAKGFAEELSSASGVDLDDMGISGSLLLLLHTSSSDIDFVVYGVENSARARDALRRLLDEGESFKRFDEEHMRSLFDFRAMETPMDYEIFVEQEKRKVIQGLYKGYVYFIRFLKDLDEVVEAYGERRCRRLGKAKVKAVVINDSESLFTPCNYEVKCLEVLEGEVDPRALREVTSFRGRFAEQAFKGEVVEVRGSLEEVRFRGELYQRIIVGGPGDYMVALSLSRTRGPP
jgi:predicted nucleotidyltransferase